MVIVRPRVEIILFDVCAVVVSNIRNPKSLMVEHNNLHCEVVKTSRLVLIAVAVLNHSLLESK